MLIVGPAQWGMGGQNTCFVWNALTVVFISVFWSCSSQYLQGTRSAGPTGRLRVRSSYPSQETKWRWSDHRSHQRRYAISLTHLNDQRHTNADLLSIGPLGTNFSEIRTKIRSFSFMKMHLKRLSEKRRLFCPGGDELTFSLKDVTYRCLS